MKGECFAPTAADAHAKAEVLEVLGAAAGVHACFGTAERQFFARGEYFAPLLNSEVTNNVLEGGYKHRLNRSNYL